MTSMDQASIRRGANGAGQRRKGSGAGVLDAPTRPDRMSFLKAFLKNPKQLGACSPSSPQLRRAQVEGIGLENATAVAELGSGSGTTTQDILKLIPGGCKFFACELNDILANDFRRRMPSVTLYQDDAMKLRSFCTAEGIEALDNVVTSLPWLLFPPEFQLALLREIHRSLRPGGKFTMLTYRYPGLPGVNRFRGYMRQVFSEVRLHKYVPINIPPASVYLCTK